MKVLVVYAHPNPASFCHAVLEAVTETLKLKNHTVEIRDLYAMHFDPVLKPTDFEGIATGNYPEDIKTEQNHIAWAEMVIVIHPIWWTGMPAMIKGFIDRIFSYGFAYSVGDQGIIKHLGGKKGHCFQYPGYTESALRDGRHVRRHEKNIGHGYLSILWDGSARPYLFPGCPLCG